VTGQRTPSGSKLAVGNLANPGLINIIPGHLNKKLGKLSEVAISTIQKAKSFLELYTSYKQVLKSWQEHCISEKIPDSTNAGITDILNYLALLHETKEIICYYNTTRSALSQAHSNI